MKKITMLATAMAAAVAFASSAQAEMKTEWVDYTQGGMKLKAYVAYDDSKTGKRPAIFMVPSRAGMSAEQLKLAEMWSKLGYIVFAADIFGYGQGILPKTAPEQVAQTDIYRKDRALMKARTQAGFDTMLKNPLVDASKVAVIGYCFGGTVAVELAETGVPIVGMISVHGSFRNFTPEAAKNIKGRVLILHGAEDPVAPLTEVNSLIDQLRIAKVGFELQLFSGTQHAFTNPKNAAEERADREYKVAVPRFLKEVFGVETASR